MPREWLRQRWTERRGRAARGGCVGAHRRRARACARWCAYAAAAAAAALYAAAALSILPLAAPADCSESEGPPAWVLPASERPTRPLAVPRVVHQTFRCWSAVPPAARMAMATWAERNPTWEVRVCAGGGCMEVAGVKG